MATGCIMSKVSKMISTAWPALIIILLPRKRKPSGRRALVLKQMNLKHFELAAIVKAQQNSADTHLGARTLHVL